MLPLIVIHSSRPFPELYLKHRIIAEEAHTRRQREIPQVTAPDLKQVQARWETVRPIPPPSYYNGAPKTREFSQNFWATVFEVFINLSTQQSNPTCRKWRLFGCVAERKLICYSGRKRAKEAAKRFFSKALAAHHITAPRVITVDKNAAYPKAFKELKAARALPQLCELRQRKSRNGSWIGFTSSMETAVISNAYSTSGHLATCIIARVTSGRLSIPNA